MANKSKKQPESWRSDLRHGNAMTSGELLRGDSQNGPRKRKTLVKICGITSAENARLACECGADFLGLVFANSPRRLSLQTARAIRAALPQTKLVGVFADQSPDEVTRISRDCGIDFVQLHGREAVEFCRNVRELLELPVIKAFEVGVWRDLEEISNFTTEDVCAFLIDSPRRSRHGDENAVGRRGTHRTGAEIDVSDAVTVRASQDPAGERVRIPFHWLLAVEAKKLGKPVFVAGGLTPDTIASAVETVEPFGVDVSSGVELRPGEKSHEKIALFVRRASGGA